VLPLDERPGAGLAQCVVNEKSSTGSGVVVFVVADDEETGREKTRERGKRWDEGESLVAHRVVDGMCLGEMQGAKGGDVESESRIASGLIAGDWPASMRSQGGPSSQGRRVAMWSSCVCLSLVLLCCLILLEAADGPASVAEQSTMTCWLSWGVMKDEEPVRRSCLRMSQEGVRTEVLGVE
jgi:hypothetical protein